MNALEASFVALFIDDCHAFRIRKENTDEGYVAFDVGAEIPEGVGMATLDDGISLRRERTHSGVPSERKRMRQVPANGTRSQSFSSRKKSRRRSASSGDRGQSLVSFNDCR